MSSAPYISEQMLERRVSLERGMRRAPPLTLTVILVNIACFIALTLQSGLKTRESLIRLGALERGAVLNGEWWRVGAANFLHADTDHLLSNMAVLFVLGMVGEHLFGGSRLFLIYTAAGGIAMAASLALDSVTVGASGAVFGVLGAVGTCVYLHRERLESREARIGLVLVAWAIYAILTAIVDPYVNNMAHAAGLIAGTLLGRTFALRLFAARPSLQAAPVIENASTSRAGLVTGVLLSMALWTYTFWFLAPALFRRK